jgi:hypothetical protein
MKLVPQFCDQGSTGRRKRLVEPQGTCDDGSAAEQGDGRHEVVKLMMARRIIATGLQGF